MLNGLDLFSGIGGITLALSPWVRPVAYCENDRYAQSVLLSRQATGELPRAPIWDDVRTLSSFDIPLPWPIDIIYGGFPCQDISVAGTGKGLAGERSGLFFEICRLTDEIRPRFIFLENVPAITTRGGITVITEFTKRGYDCRWITLSAAEIGANHIRKRWFLLAYNMADSNGSGFQKERTEQQTARIEQQSILPNTESLIKGRLSIREEEEEPRPTFVCEDVPNADGTGCKKFNAPDFAAKSGHDTGRTSEIWRENWWTTEPDVGRVAHGIPSRVDRIKGLGNAVVPLQAREAFMRLAGFK